MEGQRVKVGEHYGTIRFVGPVPPTKGTWFGVEWDDAARGKHNGTHEGIHYFTCQSDQGGSFVRPKKAEFGLEFAAAVRERYIVEDGVDRAARDHMVIKDGRNLDVEVEFVGSEKIETRQSRLAELEEVYLQNSLVDRAGPEGQIAEVCGNLHTLDLSNCKLLGTWQAVAVMAHQLPHLHTLFLNNNWLVPLDSPDCLDGHFPSLRALSLNRSNLQWPEVESLVRGLPALEELHLCDNALSQISFAHESTEAPPLALLNLQQNGFSDWAEVFKLARWSNISTLIIAENSLPDIPPDFAKAFLSLEHLSLSYNRVASWESLTQLNRAAALRRLKFRHNPLVQGDKPLTTRQIIISRLQNITFVNGSAVPPRERVNAERYYLSRFASVWKAASDGGAETMGAFAKEHPRFQELIQMHGEPAVPKVIESTALKDNMLHLTARMADAPADATVEVKVPHSITVQQVKRLLQSKKYLGAPARKQLLSLHTKHGAMVSLDDNQRDLTYYSAESGDQLVVALK